MSITIATYIHISSSDKMCVVGLPFKLYCTVNVFKVHSYNKGKTPVSGKQNNIIGIPENILHRYPLFKI